MLLHTSARCSLAQIYCAASNRSGLNYRSLNMQIITCNVYLCVFTQTLLSPLQDKIGKQQLGSPPTGSVNGVCVGVCVWLPCDGQVWNRLSPGHDWQQENNNN